MKIEAIIEQADTLVDQEIEVDGYLEVVDKGRTRDIFVTSLDEISEPDRVQIPIEHTLADIRTIIQPLPQMELIYRGVMTNPPYLYRFPLHFNATVGKSESGDITLNHITSVALDIPHTGKTSTFLNGDTYPYHAQVAYKPVPVESQQRTARATVNAQKSLILQETGEFVEVIQPDENRYARRLAGQLIQISGWLESIPSENDMINYLIFMTHSLRASMVAVGPLREETRVFLPPDEIYHLLKVHMNRRIDHPLHQYVEITGRINYLEDHLVPDIGVKSPKLIFEDIMRITIQNTAYLW